LFIGPGAIAGSVLTSRQGGRLSLSDMEARPLPDKGDELRRPKTPIKSAMTNRATMTMRHPANLPSMRPIVSPAAPPSPALKVSLPTSVPPIARRSSVADGLCRWSMLICGCGCGDAHTEPAAAGSPQKDRVRTSGKADIRRRSSCHTDLSSS
jgi:hypothetical protein